MPGEHIKRQSALNTTDSSHVDVNDRRNNVSVTDDVSHVDSHLAGADIPKAKKLCFACCFYLNVFVPHINFLY